MKNNKGFTLIELLVVVLIIGILSAVALPQYTRAVEKARVAEVESIMADLRRGYKLYKVAHPAKKAGGALEELMKAGGFSYPLSGGKIVTKNFTINEPLSPALHCRSGSCCGMFSATRTDGSYTVYFSESDPVTKCCSGSNDAGKELCNGLGTGWTTAQELKIEEISGEIGSRYEELTPMNPE